VLQSKDRTGVSRRGFLGAAAGLAAGGLLLRGATQPRTAAAAAPNGPRHLVWVWQFSTDAEPHLIGAKLRQNDLGILVKTHDGVEWMAKYDKSRYAVSGPAQIRTLADYFESGGVPFHAWAVVHGVDPIREARMAAEVVNNGARSIYLDVEPHAGFWRGTPGDAIAFGNEFRRLAPNAYVSISIDPRPWMLPALPMREFASFANELSPQQYWRTFDTPANYEKFTASGFPVGPGGMTPEFLIEVSRQALGAFGLPVNPVGQGATPDAGEWHRFVNHAYGAGSSIVSVWRYGVTTEDVLGMLRVLPPPQPVVPALGIHTVEAGDTLSAIAARYGVSVDEIVALNGIADPSYLYVGQQLKLSGGGEAAPVAIHAAAVTAATRSHVVEPGETLSTIASRYSTTVDAIARANGIANVNYLYIGQELAIPA
jgi:LysM repeat protein